MKIFFKVLFTEGRDDKKNGRPNVALRILIGMCIFKEGSGCSDEQLYEQCRYNLLYRKALGVISLDEQCPSINTCYTFRRCICDYEEKTGVNLFDFCFKQITKAQITEYRMSGHTVRMDSKLISSNIAWFSRYEIIHATLLKEITKDGILQVEDQLIRQQTLEFFDEDAAKTVYQTIARA